MEFHLVAHADSKNQGIIDIRESKIKFGVTKDAILPSPADLLVSSFAACCLKNIERFSEYMHYTYSQVTIDVKAIRTENPPKIETLDFTIRIRTSDSINTSLLLRNLSKHGTIYNTLNQACQIKGEILLEH